MVENLSDMEAPAEETLASRALFLAVTELPVEVASELARRITQWVVIQSQNQQNELHALAARDGRFTAAVLSVAAAVERTPSTTDYQREYERRRDIGQCDIPSLSAVLKHFDGWPYALAAAGLIGSVGPQGIQRLRARGVLRPPRYTNQALRDALIACARDLERVPTVRDYAGWREHILEGRPKRRMHIDHIPHYRTICNRYGSWMTALEDAGIDAGDETRLAWPRPSATSDDFPRPLDTNALWGRLCEHPATRGSV